MRSSTVLAHQLSVGWSRGWPTLGCIKPSTSMRRQLLEPNRWRRNGSTVLGGTSVPFRLVKHFDHLPEPQPCEYAQLWAMTATNGSWMSTFLLTNTGFQQA